MLPKNALIALAVMIALGACCPIAALTAWTVIRESGPAAATPTPTPPTATPQPVSAPQTQGAEIQASAQCRGLIVSGSCNVTTETDQQQAQQPAPSAPAAPLDPNAARSFELLVCFALIGLALVGIVGLAIARPYGQ
jgi:hypothetical protein